MAKRRHQEEFEIPFVALMDTMTNVVGVLIIVLVLVGISVSSAVKKILSDLPPVTIEQLDELQKVMAKQEPIPLLKDVKDQTIVMENMIKKNNEEISSLDQTAGSLQANEILDLEKQLDEKKKERDVKKLEANTLIAEIEKIKAQLDQTPIQAVSSGSIVRLPNPKPYPDKPEETLVFVSKEGIAYFNEKEVLKPTLTELERSRSQLRYKSADISPFLPMLQKLFASKQEIDIAWRTFAPLINKFQVEELAKTWKVLSAGDLTPNLELFKTVGNISIVLRKPMQDVASAVVAASKFDYKLWEKMSPSQDPTKPEIKVNSVDNKLTFHWYQNIQEVRVDSKSILRYFKNLSDTDGFKKAAKEREIYDVYKVAAFLESSDTPKRIENFTFSADVNPTSNMITFTLIPKSLESVDEIKQSRSRYLSVLREVKQNQSGVLLFKVKPDAIPIYLAAREVSNVVGVPAAWDYVSEIKYQMNVPNFEVQRYSESLPLTTGTGTPNLITAPKRSLD
jgi:hypothetical protein